MKEMKRTLWLTYAWVDNSHGDVDFMAQELMNSGLNIKLDRWTIQAGKRLWEQISTFIQDATESDAWAIYATPNSLGSEPCKEEYAYALDRALQARGATFPIIGIFPGQVDTALIPAGIRTRLYVSLTDADWKERVKSSVEGRSPSIIPQHLQPYYLKVHQNTAPGSARYIIEVRPRAGTWAPFIAAIPLSEKDTVKPSLSHGHKDSIPLAAMMVGAGEGVSNDHKWWFLFSGNEASPTQSYFIYCNQLPSVLAFGVNGAPSQYMVTFS